jgi:hypothetical protein
MREVRPDLADQLMAGDGLLMTYLAGSEVEALMAAARKGSRYGYRDAIMILIAYRHGLRAAECLRPAVGLGGFRRRGATSVASRRAPRARTLTCVVDWLVALHTVSTGAACAYGKATFCTTFFEVLNYILLVMKRGHGQGRSSPT